MSARGSCLLFALTTILISSASVGDPKPSEVAPRPPKADRDMQEVLDVYEALGAKPFETLPPELARRQPTLPDAVEVVLTRQLQAEPAVEPVAKIVNRTYGPHEIPLRIYTPKEGIRPYSVILYFHGGGWVIGDLDLYDATPRALANATGAIVVSASYRQAPEHKFPAAHEDAFDAYRWVLEHARSFGGNPRRVAVAGESAGGNLAINVAIRARDEKLTAPRHMLLVYPIAGANMATPSYVRNANAKPLGKAGMAWFFKYVFADPAQVKDPRIDLVSRKDLAGL
ncbi:MAG: alpha/beta hydrolase fold domain-containing protein, partial [Deltaproteobacteria bacterium]|nr:alpha/beta hydrolase fold domain-containing protein [Deltaproteobacteria bacterium]